MGLVWSNSWSLDLIFGTLAKKNVTFNLSKFGGQSQHISPFMIFGIQKIGKIIKNSKQLGTSNHLLETFSKVMD